MNRLPDSATMSQVIQTVNDILETLGCIPALEVKCKENCKCSICYEKSKK